MAVRGVTLIPCVAPQVVALKREVSAPCPYMATTRPPPTHKAPTNPQTHPAGTEVDFQRGKRVDALGEDDALTVGLPPP
jgi:hypothetical protein